MKDFSIMQGDQYAIPFMIRDRAGTPLGRNDVENVEITIGDTRKEMKSGEIVYREDDGAFLFPISQKESFSMVMRKQRVQVRVKFPNTNEVIGKDLGDVLLTYSGSKEVL